MVGTYCPGCDIWDGLCQCHRPPSLKLRMSYDQWQKECQAILAMETVQEVTLTTPPVLTLRWRVGSAEFWSVAGHEHSFRVSDKADWNERDLIRKCMEVAWPGVKFIIPDR